MEARTFLSDNKKTIDKDKKKEIKSRISSLEKAVRFKKPEKLEDEEALDIKEKTEELKNSI